jgi:hypothetical protein
MGKLLKKQITMNKFHAEFDYVIDGNIIIITDLNYGGKSVTNDIENVIRDISMDLKRESGCGICNYKIIYQDSQGMFDEVLVNEKGEFKNFRCLYEKSITKAKEKIK